MRIFTVYTLLNGVSNTCFMEIAAYIRHLFCPIELYLNISFFLYFPRYNFFLIYLPMRKAVRSERVSGANLFQLYWLHKIRCVFQKKSSSVQNLSPLKDFKEYSGQ